MAANCLPPIAKPIHCSSAP
ncbi:unnamed protein product [Linum tenue]|uniref:Uncharacterized protein n=1 Tax=Linum tenue TaxID=586396 RepID=A0AAV0M274_9ROSI|nr:unnamed protein product [Linum tenue]